MQALQHYSVVPRPFPDFISHVAVEKVQLQDEIWEWSGNSKESHNCSIQTVNLLVTL